MHHAGTAAEYYFLVFGPCAHTVVEWAQWKSSLLTIATTLQMTYCVHRVTQTKKYPTWAGIVLALMLVGGVAASQTWCWKLSKRLWHPYRRAYGTQLKANAEHIDNYTPEHSSNGTGSSSGTASGGHDVAAPFRSAGGKNAEGAATEGSFPRSDPNLSNSARNEGKKVL